MPTPNALAELQPASVLIDPPAGAWADLLRRRRSAGDLHPLVRAFRLRHGMSLDRPILMTGHQPALWHNGILAKYIAADVASVALGADLAWILVDQDVGDPGGLRWPERQRSGRWIVREASLLAQSVAAEVPYGMQPPSAIAPPGEVPLRCPIQSASTEARNAAEQIFETAISSAGSLLRRTAEPDGLTRLNASALHEDAIFKLLLDRMIAEPAACVGAYNAVVASRPEAGMRPLMLKTGSRDANADRIELPLWRIRPSQPRLPVYAHELPSIPQEELAPRALFMTGIIRLVACDLFIHGTGGGDYDPASEAWFRAWVPDLVDDLGFAPMAVVSATLRLPIAENLPTTAEVDAGVWRAHRALHDPALVGDPARAEEKQALVRAIDDAKSRGQDPAPAFAAMHALLARYRQERAADLQRLADEAAELRARLLDAAIIADRTYPFVLFDPGDLHRRLREPIERAFAAASTAPHNPGRTGQTSPAQAGKMCAC